jgi:hypothetical protein
MLPLVSTPQKLNNYLLILNYVVYIYIYIHIHIISYSSQTKQQQQQQQQQKALPWEAEEESLAILSQDVMERILKLSLSERNFTIDPTTIFPPEGNPTQVAFDFEEFVPVAMKIMSVDANLTQMHAKVCPKMDSEEIFWRNYYYRLRYIRGAYGLEGQAVRDAYKPINESVLIFAPVFVYTEPESIIETPVGDKSGKSLMYSTPIHASKGSSGGVGNNHSSSNSSMANSSKRQSPISNANSPLSDRDNASYETTPSSLFSCSLSPENGGGGEQSKISPEEERRKTDEAKLAAEVCTYIHSYCLAKLALAYCMS